MDSDDLATRVANARIIGLEAKIVLLTNFVVLLMARRAQDFEDPVDFVTTLTEATRESADGYDPDNPDLVHGHDAILDWTDDFEERVLRLL